MDLESNVQPEQPFIPGLVSDSDIYWTLACSQSQVDASLTQFLEITDLLLEQVQLNSTHLFRADILHDSSGKLETLYQKEAKTRSNSHQIGPESVPRDAPLFRGFKHDRTVLRRLIPRKPQLDDALEQTCLFYHNESNGDSLIIYLPHCVSAASMPWYHPQIKGLAYRFSSDTSSNLAVYYLPFPDTSLPIPDRLTRTFTSLLKTMIRLLKLPSKAHIDPTPNDSDVTTTPLTASSLKDTVLPQHTVQNTYSLLKQKYASSLISKWVESTEPSKHVFEDISIAAFLIELWKAKYGSPEKSPGFVDIACGNGVLTYLLLSEGWKGYGFDARARKTWQILDTDDYLEEKLCIPGSFFNCLSAEEQKSNRYMDGTFPPGTFIISNHADELTCWTPLLAALSNPSSPLPFLAIPCCSHALDGSKNRYTLNDVYNTKITAEETAQQCGDYKEQPEKNRTGDLKALRAQKLKAAEHNDDKSQYACLTRKTAAIAQELGFDVQLTLMRIPSTRNIGVLGNCRVQGIEKVSSAETGTTIEVRSEKIHHFLKRELSKYGGLETAAKTWIGRAQNLQAPKGRGKFRSKPDVTHPDTEADNDLSMINS